MSDAKWMLLALEQAEIAYMQGEVPIGAVIVFKDSYMIGSGYNSVIVNNDPCDHAEIIAIRKACGYQKNYRLHECTLYTTLEPCLMCMGAIIHSRIKHLVYSAASPLYGTFTKKYLTLQQARDNYNLQVRSGTCRSNSASLMKKFFESLRY